MIAQTLLGLIALTWSTSVAARNFTIATEPFSEDEIVDARAQPDINGGASIMLTFSEAGSARIAAVTRRNLEREVPVVLDGKTIAMPMVQEAIEGGTMVMAGFTTAEAEELARTISGKDPLPDSLDD